MLPITEEGKEIVTIYFNNLHFRVFLDRWRHFPRNQPRYDEYGNIYPRIEYTATLQRKHLFLFPSIFTSDRELICTY